MDIVGLYLNPPERALVLSVDEENQIQAVERIQPGRRDQRLYRRKGTGGSSRAVHRSTPYYWLIGLG
jgi:hypothetical protein